MKISKLIKFAVLAVVVSGTLVGCIVLPGDCHDYHHEHREHRGGRDYR